MGKGIEVVKLVVSIGICQLAAAVGAIFTTAAIPTWYAALSKPSFNPPNWIFGPVWFTLYTLMGIAAYLVWRQGLSGSGVRVALLIFIVQLVVNVLWSAIFFGLQSLLGGLVVIVILWAAILWTIIKFYPLSAAAGLLLVPYLLWVSFASVLNFSIFLLN